MFSDLYLTLKDLQGLTETKKILFSIRRKHGKQFIFSVKGEILRAVVISM